MIRVNLLPQKKERAAVAVGAEAEPGLAHRRRSASVAARDRRAHRLPQGEAGRARRSIQRKNDQSAEHDRPRSQRQIANHADIKSQLKELRDREDAIAEAAVARTGPTSAMLELSHILTPGRGPTTDRDKLEQLKRDDPSEVPNPNWDPRRLWLQDVLRHVEDREARRVCARRGGRVRVPTAPEAERLLLRVKLLPAAKRTTRRHTRSWSGSSSARR